MEKRIKSRFWLTVGMVLGAAAMRLLPHPPNFTPIAAMALFGGAHFERKRCAFAVPLAAMFLSDLVLEIIFGWGFHALMPIVYASFAVVVGLGLLLRSRRRAFPVAAAAVVASTLFYLLTNFAVWASSGMYPATPAGLVACYVAALPFFGLTLAGDLFYTAILFGAFMLLERRFSLLAPAQAS